MFRADGLGVRKQDDGTIVVEVRFFRDDVAPKKVLFEHSFTGTDFANIKAQVDVMLTKLKTAETDVELNAQFVGVTISSN